MSEFLAGAGVLIAAGASAAAILLPPSRRRSLAMLVAIVLFPVLILGDQWHTAQIVDLRHDTGRIVALLAIAAAAIGGLAYGFRRWPLLLPLAIVFALPFRVPLEAGGDTANLLVPLYLVIAAGVAAVAVRDWGARAGGFGGSWLPRILAAVVVLYALQTLYSEDFSKGLQNVCFFLVPFTVAYSLLSDVRWDKRLLTLVLAVVGVEATAFVLIGSVEYLSRDLFWNDQVIRSNEFHTYFRVNSVFWDPNVYGRYLSLVAVLATAALLWVRDRREFALLTALLGLLWIGLAETFSQSSYIALLGGLAVLAAIRWSLRWTLAAVAVGAVGAVLVVLLAGGSEITTDRLNVDLSGRGNLVSGGVDLFAERPLWGYGSGSFQEAYRDHRENKDAPVTISHTEPVTILAEQGLIGLALYAALLLVALWTMATGVRGPPAGADAARPAVLAAFVALLIHTLAYAGFYEDPITWVLLAVGVSLAGPAVRDPA
ncbi:MAG TPA: O-antigen ligase family protein [Solirubrobacterales bacterium]|nr:O-antigen ligase family protein [Solirubrobacterales bacterium]